MTTEQAAAGAEGANTQATTQVDTASTQTGTAAAAPTPEQIAQQVADTAKAEADKATADAAKVEADKLAVKPEGAPEKYEIKLAEGHTLDASVQSQFEAVARELNLPNAAAQKLIETMGPQIAQAQADAVAKVHTE